jgi:flagellar basal body-associated protein FliL
LSFRRACRHQSLKIVVVVAVVVVAVAVVVVVVVVKNKMGEDVARMWDRRGAYEV